MSWKDPGGNGSFWEPFPIHWNGWFSQWLSSIFIENVGFVRHDLGNMNLNIFCATSNSIATALIWVKTAIKPFYSQPFSKRWKFTFLVEIEGDNMTILIFFCKQTTNTENSNFLVTTWQTRWKIQFPNDYQINIIFPGICHFSNYF